MQEGARLRASAMTRPVRAAGTTSVRRLILVAAAAIAATCALVPAAQAAAPTIVNNGGVNNWVEAQSINGEGNTTGNKFWFTLVVRHDVGQKVDTVLVDDNHSNATFDTVDVVATAQQPNPPGGFDYTRVTVVTTPETGGFSCPIIGTRTRRRDDQYQVRARTVDNQETQTLSFNMHRVAAGTCVGSEDYPYIYDQTQTATDANPGQAVTFQYRGDDFDDAGGCNFFDGIRWRARRLSDGAVTATTTVNTPNDDNDLQTQVVTFPNRGRWVVEAELACNDMNFIEPGRWFRLGAVDVNSPAASSPDITLSGVPARPNFNQTFTATATVNDNDDNAQGGRAQYVEWDTDFNGSYDSTTLGDPTTGLASSTRTINTTGLTPGLYTIKARVTDNGAINGADNIRRQKEVTAQFRVDAAPVANAQSVSTETGVALPIQLTGSDPDGDALSYSIVSGPSNGSLALAANDAADGITGDDRVYTSNATFAGADSFVFQVNDGFGRTANATVSIRVNPQTQIDSGPNGPHNSTTATFNYSSPATNPNIVFECRLDPAAGDPFVPCGNGSETYTGLTQGSHTFEVRAKLPASPDFIDPTPDTQTFIVDTVAPTLTFTQTPDEFSNDSTPTFAYSPDEAVAGYECDFYPEGGTPTFAPCTNPVSESLPDAEYEFAVRATDLAGNTGPAITYDWLIDTVLPETTLDQTPDAIENTDAATFEFSSDELVGTTFECRLDSSDPGDWAPCTSPRQLTGLGEGSHTFEVRATDRAGNTDASPDSFTWVVDTIAPLAAVITDGPGNASGDSVTDDEAQLTFTGEAGATLECRLDRAGAPEGSFAQCSSPRDYANLVDGEYTFLVRVVDAAGNVSPEATYEWTVDSTPGLTQIVSGPPRFTNNEPAPTPFVFSSTESPVTYQCQLDVLSPTPSTGTPAACNETGEIFPAGGGTDGTTYRLRVRSVDSAGNVDITAAQRRWTVDLTDPTATISPDRTLTTDTSATFTLGADEVATFECRLDSNCRPTSRPATRRRATATWATGRTRSTCAPPIAPGT